MKKTILGAALAISFLGTAQAQAAISCQADVDMFVKGAKAIVQINNETKPEVSGQFTVAGETTQFLNAKVSDFSVRANLPALSNAMNSSLNAGELRVALLATYLADEDIKSALHLDLNFGLNEVASARIYDLAGDAFTNEMGGSPLVELRNSKGEVLGRFVQSIALVPCK